MKSPDVDITGERKVFSRDSDLEGRQSWENLYGGKGTVSIKRFPFSQAAHPANFVTYDLPPGASEGVHTHKLNDEEAGSFDEFYYIVSGDGQMEIDGEIVPVQQGDHVYVPVGLPHGIENTSVTDDLKVFLTFIHR